MSKIEWTDVTWNPVTGCDKVSQGCKNCYAEVMHKRLMGMFPKKYMKPFLGNIQLHPKELEKPARWRKPRMVFVNSMSDLFHKDVPFPFIQHVFAVMATYTDHTYQIVTKRADRMLEFFHHMQGVMDRVFDGKVGKIQPLANVWLGVSCEDQKTAEERIPLLLQCPAAIHFVSCEPLLGPIDHVTPSIKWVICGGESGHHARPMHPDWVRSLRDQCAAAGVPFFFKQWGEWNPDDFDTTIARRVDEHGTLMYKVGKKRSGNLLDGKRYLEFPNEKTRSDRRVTRSQQ